MAHSDGGLHSQTVGSCQRCRMIAICNLQSTIRKEGLMKSILRIVGLALGMAVLLSMAGVSGAQAQQNERCFPETGFCITGRVREFWEQNGGLAVFGYPLAQQQQE